MKVRFVWANRGRLVGHRHTPDFEPPAGGKKLGNFVLTEKNSPLGTALLPPHGFLLGQAPERYFKATFFYRETKQVEL
jgi:hypothetical protein